MGFEMLLRRTSEKEGIGRFISALKFIDFLILFAEGGWWGQKYAELFL